jgi:hypothetical protein
MKKLLLVLATLLPAAFSPLHAADRDEAAVQALKSRLLTAETKHLNLLLAGDGSIRSLKGKTADGQEALAFYLMFEMTGDQRYRRAATELTDRVLKDMRATKFGVLPIKEKDKPGGKKIMGGGPPAFGFYTANAAYILHKEGGRDEDLRYVAQVIDQYPWNELGWWSADIDVATGESKVPLSKPSIINKSATMAMAAGMVSEYVRAIDPALAARLKAKTDQCIYQKILPAQLDDGFWHYSLMDNDPKDKDILGYFMLTTQVLMELQHFNPAYRESRLDAALRKAQDFSLKNIAPMMDPNSGPPCAAHSTSGTPRHYALAEEPKRGFALSLILLGAGHFEEGTKIIDASIANFPYGDPGQDGAHAAEPAAVILSWLR